MSSSLVSSSFRFSNYFFRFNRLLISTTPFLRSKTLPNFCKSFNQQCCYLSLNNQQTTHHQQSFNSSRSALINGEDSNSVQAQKHESDEGKAKTQSDLNKPSEEQLVHLTQRMSENLSKFFKHPHDFRMYNPKIIFEDNIRHVRTEGMNAYAWQLAKVKMGAHFKYGKVQFNILKITHHPEDDTIKVRWRIVTYPGNKIIFAFWQFKLWKYQESIDQFKDDWIDGFSVFYVGGDGLIYKHVCDKVIPDSDPVKSKTDGSKLANKLGSALGLTTAATATSEQMIDTAGDMMIQTIVSSI